MENKMDRFTVDIDSHDETDNITVFRGRDAWLKAGGESNDILNQRAYVTVEEFDWIMAEFERRFGSYTWHYRGQVVITNLYRQVINKGAK